MDEQLLTGGCWYIAAEVKLSEARIKSVSCQRSLYLFHRCLNMPAPKHSRTRPCYILVVLIMCTLLSLLLWLKWTSQIWPPAGRVSSYRSVNRKALSRPGMKASTGRDQSWKVQNGGRDRESGSFATFPEKSPYLYTYSAFWDDRGSPMEEPVIRILAIAETEKLEEANGLQCLVSCEDDADYAAATVEMVPWSDPKQRYMFERKTWKVANITVMPKSNVNGSYFMKYVAFCRFVATCPLKLCSLGETRVSIGPPLLLTLESSSVPVEIPRKPEKPMKLGLCTSLSYWNIDPTRAVEWLEMQRILGVGGVVIYNDSLDAAVSEVFRHYDKTDFVDLRQCHPLFGSSSRFDIRIRSALTTTDCLYRYMYTFRNIIVIDTDEFIYPARHIDLVTLMDQLRNETSTKTVNWVFQNVNFIFDEVLGPNIDVTKPRELAFLRHRQRLPVSQKHDKSIINPMECVVVFNHYCKKCRSPGRKQVLRVDPDVGYLRHYRNSLCKESGVAANGSNHCADRFPVSESFRDNSILRFEALLTKAVLEKCSELGLLNNT